MSSLDQQFIPYGRQTLTEADIAAVERVLRGPFLTQGPAVPAFEQAVAAKLGAQYGVAVNSATSALHIACLALGLGPGDRLWTSPITFVASANCGRYCGADIDFVDIDPATGLMSVAALALKLEQAACDGHLPKILVPVHLAGTSCDMAGISEFANRYGILVIEDASHSIGGLYREEPVGNCRYSAITVFSFHPVKIITTGEGGMATTNDPLLAQRMAGLRSHGIVREAERFELSPAGPWAYEQQDLGFNYRMTDLQAALGLSQLSRLDAYVERRHEIAQAYDRQLAGLPLTLPWQHPDSYSGLHLYVVRLRLDQVRLTHRAVFEALRARGLGVNLHYIPVHTQPYYQRLGFRVGQYPEAERYYAEAISLPMYATLTDAQQQEVVRVLREVIAG